ncbi:flagellar brake domain-containing protein [Peribacillus simplex]|uniref:flagellar brake domain-containing protein n=1 Tax=Peribacillus simplex TaxID=1478 RepID=UPI00399B671B|nr:flagellar brake domain-containing protein [Peribacillus simplex]
MYGCRNGNGLFLYGLSHRCIDWKNSFLMDGTQFNITFSNEEQAVYVFESEVLGKVKGRTHDATIAARSRNVC